MSDDREPWHLDKKIPISLIVYLVIQTATIVWYGGRLDQNVTQVMMRTTNIEAWKDRQDGYESKTEARLAVIESRMGELTETTHHIDNRLEESLQRRR